MIECHLSRIIGGKLLRISDVAWDTGINRETTSRLFTETASRVDFNVLESLCRCLKYQIGDVIKLEE